MQNNQESEYLILLNAKKIFKEKYRVSSSDVWGLGQEYSAFDQWNS